MTEEQLVQLYDLMKWGPTSANPFPIRIVFVTTPAAKERLTRLVSEGNRPKVAAAPVSAILAYDTKFYDWLPACFRTGTCGPISSTSRNSPRRPRFAQQPAGCLFHHRGARTRTGPRPMSGFDNAALYREFFPDGQLNSNFICSLGYGDSSGVFDRLPRPTFSEACRVE